MRRNTLFLLIILSLAVSTVGAQTTAEDFFNSGLKKFEAKNWDGAIADFTKVIEIVPNVPEFLLPRSSPSE